jgi:hypothetical protein
MLATSRRFVALLAARMKARVETRLTTLIQIDGFHMDEDMLFVAGMARRERRQTSVRPRRRETPPQPANVAAESPDGGWPSWLI